MNSVSGEIVGNIHVTVCKTPEGDNFFQLQADTENVLPVLDAIENILINY